MTEEHGAGPDLEEQLTLVEVLNRVLDRGAVISGEVTISVAGIDLVELGLNVYLASTETARRSGMSVFPGRRPPPSAGAPPRLPPAGGGPA